MCELLGLCFARPISADFSIRRFADRDEQNADGWGLAWYPDRSVALIKEPVSWRESKHTGFLESYQRLLSSIYIAHVRHKTVGGPPTHADTHPFTRELTGREYCFAHNGTLLDLAAKHPLERFRPVGDTDSEYVFCHILDELWRRRIDLADPSSWDWLRSKLSDLNQLGKLNCLLSDGTRLFAYHDQAGYKGLTLRKVRLGGDHLRQFEDNELQLHLDNGVANDGFAIATHPLSAAGWHNFRPGELVIIEEGKLRYSSHLRESEPAATR